MSEARDTLFIPVDVIDQVESALNAAIGITLMHAKTQQPAILAAAIALTEAINNQPDLAAIRALQEPAIPAGWKMVPVEPTQEMIDAWTVAKPSGDTLTELQLDEISDDEANRRWATADYKAMLAAAPTPAPEKDTKP